MMAPRKNGMVLFSIFTILVCFFGYVIQAGAETWNYKAYSWVMKSDSYPVGDKEGHNIGSMLRGTFYAFENGEIATATVAGTFDYLERTGPFVNYVTMNFEDGSIIMIKTQATFSGGSSGWTSEIIKGTGRFNGIKGIQKTTKSKLYPVEKGEAGARWTGEGNLTFTLPPK
jgi:hypothetical protein